jgi:hypothetical protein
LLDLVGEGRAVDTAVGHPPARQTGSVTAAAWRPRARVERLAEQPAEVEILVELLELVSARPFERVLEHVGQRAEVRRRRLGVACLRVAGSGGLLSRAGRAVAVTFTGGRRVGRADDLAIGARGVVERVELAVGDPHEPGVEVIERPQVGSAQCLTPHSRDRSEHARLDDPVVRARLQVDARAPRHVARQRLADERGAGDLFGEARQHHVDDGGLERAAHEAAADAGGGELAHAVGLHPWLLQKPPVDRELPLGRVAGVGEGEVVLDGPALGVLGVEGLVQRDAEAAEHRARLQLSGGDLRARTKQLVGVEVDRARDDLDVAGV